MKTIRLLIGLIFTSYVAYLLYFATLQTTNPHFGNSAANKIFNSPHQTLLIFTKDDDDYMGPYNSNQQNDSYKQYITDQPFLEPLVSFHAPWCQKCNKIRDIIFKVSGQLDQIYYIRCFAISYNGDELTEIEKANFEPILFWRKDKSNQPLVYRGQESVEGILRWLKKVSEHQFPHPDYRYFGERTVKRIKKWLNRCFSYPFSHQLYEYDGEMTVSCLMRTIKRYIPFIEQTSIVEDQRSPEYYQYYETYYKFNDEEQD